MAIACHELVWPESTDKADSRLAWFVLGNLRWIVGRDKLNAMPSEFSQDSKANIAKGGLRLPIVLALFRAELVQLVTIPCGPAAAFADVLNYACALRPMMASRGATFTIDFSVFHFAPLSTARAARACSSSMS